ncbi:MAG: MIP/aquaporin family protein [Phycisphaerales bacterium]
MRHLTEYIIEGCLLAAFMISACVTTAVVEHPSSAVRQGLRNAAVRRGIIGLVMGLTAVALIYSPPGQRSGAHMNPAVTLSFLYLGKIDWGDAAGYITAQVVGGIVGVGVCCLPTGLTRRVFSHPSVMHVATVPARGIRAALLGEFAISALLIACVLTTSNYAPTSAYTGLFAGALVAVYIAVEAPYSGMSMNPARTLGSAVFSRRFTGMWVYVLAPIGGMLSAAAAYASLDQHVYCAKFSLGSQQT